MKCLFSAVAAIVFSLAVSAQSAGKADVFSAGQLHSQLTTLAAQAAASGSAGATLGDYGNHKLQISVRTASGGAEIHAHWDDVMIVQKGSATLITGGSIPDAKTSAEGETKGASVQGGQSRTISAGDIVTVNAGVPHQILVSAGTTYSAIVLKVHE
jgi:mannose-6-phosphate isomerase-like protein (cupin superfamily)